MNLQNLFDPQIASKAIAAGVITLLVGELARYGFHPHQQYIDATGVIVTGVVAYLIGHMVVWLAPKNKDVVPPTPVNVEPVKGAK